MPKKKKAPAPAKAAEAKAAKKYQKQQLDRQQAAREKARTKRLMRGLTLEKIKHLKQYEFNTLLLRKQAELAIVESLPDPAKKSTLEPLIDLKFDLRRMAAGGGFQRSFESLVGSVRQMLEGQRTRFLNLVERTKGSPLQKRWDKRLEKVTGLLEKTDSFARRVAEAGGRRQSTIRQVLKSKTIWIRFLEEAENAFEFGLGGKETKDYFARQMEKISQHVNF